MRILLRTKGDRTLALESDTHVLLFRYIATIGKCAIELVTKNNFNSNHYRSLSRHKPLGFLGLISMNKHIFLCVITSKFDIASPREGEIIHRIRDVEFHCLTSDSWDFVELSMNGFPVDMDVDTQPGAYSPRFEQHPCFELRKLLVDGSFFYSTDFDLTSTLQGRGADPSAHKLSMERFHTDYMWNAFMMEEIIKFRNNLEDDPKLILDNNKFLTTVIRGYAETLKINLRGTNARITIISKQSWKRAGTRFNVRGVDDDGNVANFVETELIYNDVNHLFSFVEIRGSIPVFWEQDTALISPKVQITRSFDATQPVFDKHFENLNGKYGPVHIVNLLSKTKASEIELSTKYKQHFTKLENIKPDSVFFTDFDFHQETSKTYAHAAKVLGDLQPSLNSFGYFCYDKKLNETIMEQQGVFRTNCLDCLDRTNVVQQVISLAAFEEFLTNLDKVDNKFDVENKHRILWANHGDQISQIYTGTNALKSSFSRSGKMGFAGALSDATKSLSRIYVNNFVDKGKQQVTDTLLGKSTEQEQVLIFDPVTEYINENIHKYESKFTKHEDISIFVGTYNLAGSSTCSEDLSDWLSPNDTIDVPPADILMIGFQEVIELTATNILKNDASPSKYWQTIIQKHLDHISPESKYVLLRAEHMSSVLLLFYVKTNVVSKISQVEGKSKKTGLGGMTANKGSVAIRFNYGSSSFCFFNSHLAAGTINIDERYNDFVTSWNGIRFSGNKLIKHHDNIVWLGDLNYRISKPNEEVRSLIERGKMNTLLEFDQLSYELKRRHEMKGFKELPITFKPTYKFDKGTNVYDTSEKQRVPSWTDRIVYRGKEISQTIYSITTRITFSDHKPVYGIFTANVRIENSDVKKKVLELLHQQYKTTAVKSEGKLIELNDLDSVSIDSDSRKSYSPSSSSTTSMLIDLDDDNEITPKLPRRATTRSIPPAYNQDEIRSMLVPALSHSFHTNLTTGGKAPAAPPARRKTTTPSNKANRVMSPDVTLSVMQPTRSRTGSPIAKQPIRTPPPTSKTSTPVKSTSSSSTSTPTANSAAPPPPPPRRATTVAAAKPPSTANGQANISQKSETHKKVAPIVPVKPKALDNVVTGSTNDGSSDIKAPVEKPINSWTVMTPTKRL